MTDTSDPKDPTGGFTSSSTPGPTNPGNTGGPATSTSGGDRPGSAERRASASFGGAGQPMSSAGDSGSESGSESLTDTARSALSDAAHAARGMASDQTDRAKSAVAEEVSSVAQALRTAANELREGSAQERTFAQIADTLADTAETIRGKDMAEMVQEATRLARRNPMTFLGAAALLGFTAVRFAKASHDDTWRRRGGYRSTGARHGVSTHPVDPSASAASMGSTS